MSNKMVDYKSLCHLMILLLSLCFMLVHCALEPADQFLDNPSDAKQDPLNMHKRPSFFVGSRYGRSGASANGGSGNAYAPSKTRRLNVVPRNDRFFLGSRYGKRAGTPTMASPLLSTPYEQALFSEISTGTQLSNKPNDEIYNGNGWESNGNSNSPAAGYYMQCIYTGLQNFYRCNSIDMKFYVENSTPFNKNDANVNDNDVNAYGGYDNDNDVDDDDDDDNDLEQGRMENDNAVNEVLSTYATGRINDAATHHEGRVGAIDVTK